MKPMTSSDLKPILESIDKDIATHTAKADEFLFMVYAMLAIALFFSVLYVAPGMAERALPKAESELSEARTEYNQKLQDYKNKYKEEPYTVTNKALKAAEEEGRADQKMRDAHYFYLTAPSDRFVQIYRLLSSLKIEDSKMEGLGKIIPLILGGALAGFLLTYRFHVQTAKDFTLKKIELLSKYAHSGDS